MSDSFERSIRRSNEMRSPEALEAANRAVGVPYAGRWFPKTVEQAVATWQRCYAAGFDAGRSGGNTPAHLPHATCSLPDCPICRDREANYRDMAHEVATPSSVIDEAKAGAVDVPGNYINASSRLAKVVSDFLAAEDDENCRYPALHTAMHAYFEASAEWERREGEHAQRTEDGGDDAWAAFCIQAPDTDRAVGWPHFKAGFDAARRAPERSSGDDDDANGKWDPR